MSEPNSKLTMILKLISMLLISICNAEPRSPWQTESKRYDNYTLFRGIPFLNMQMKFLKNLYKHFDVDYWREPSVLRMPVDFVIAPADKIVFQEEANHIGLFLIELMSDVQKAINSQIIKPYTRSLTETYNWDNYFKLADIYLWMRDLASMHPNEVIITKIGKTHEERDILAMTIILKNSMRRSKVIIEGGIHAREWISPAFVTYMINQIINSSNSRDEKLKRIAQTYEWIFVPILNPDGYHHTHAVDRFWKKNCNGVGVDLNRNFGFMFGRWSAAGELAAVSSSPTSNNYMGPSPFSESETRAMRDLVTQKKYGLEYYISFHSYNKRIIIPYEHSQEILDNYDEVYDMAKKAAQEMKMIGNNHYTVGNQFEMYGECVGGTSTSWAKRTFEIPYALTFELQDPNFGFLLPPKMITPTCVEAMVGVLSLLDHTNKLSPNNLSITQRKRTKRYDNKTLFRGIPSRESHLDFLKRLPDNFKVNFWMKPGSLRMPVELVVERKDQTEILKQAKNISFPLNLVMDDIQKVFDNETVHQYTRRGMKSFNWDQYYNTDSINCWLKDMAREHSPEMLVQSIGTTYQNRQILVAIVILKGSLRRSKVIIEGGIHGREWISPAFVTYMIDHILKASKSKNNNLKNIANTYEWYFIPIANPDGYEYSHTMDRIWSKNCNGPGIDLNRNFGHKFAAFASDNPKSDTYCGKNAFSEKESIALMEFILGHKENLEYYFSFHAYGQYMTIPYGHTTDHLDNYQEVKKQADKAARIINSRLKTHYKVGTPFETYGYLISGTSTDWVKYALKVPFVLTIALQGKDPLGFTLAPKLIRPTCEGVIEGLLSLLTPKSEVFFTLKTRYERNAEEFEELHHKARFLPNNGANRLILYKCFMLYVLFYKVYFV